MQSRTDNNAITFLMDEEFFQELHRQLSRILLSKPHAKTYVAIAMWSCDIHTQLPAVQVQDHQQTRQIAQRTLQDVLTALDAAGHRAYIILWEGSSVKGVTGFEQGAENRAVRQFAESLPNKNVHVYLESYKSTVSLGISVLSVGTSAFGFGASNHQKVVICAHQGKLTAILGGFNLSDEYSSPPDHGHAANYWHDTAVLLRGPAAADVQDEWLRRWNKQATGKNPLPPVSLGAQKVQVPTSKITIATTNSEQTTRENDIRDLMVHHIKEAKRYVYLENYALTDPAIVQALWQALSTNRRLLVVILINHPRSELFWAHTYWSYLHYYTFVHLSLARASSITVKSPEAQSDVNSYRFYAHSGSQTLTDDEVEFLEPEDSFCYWRERGGQRKLWRCHFDNITDLHAPTVLYGPRTAHTHTSSKGVRFRRWPYPHSKLALFDDSVAAIGSANWTYRSMEYDGEISAFIRSSSEVPAIRKKLLRHWWQNRLPDGDWSQMLNGWRIRAQDDNEELREAPDTRLNRLHCYIMPLKFGDFMHPSSTTFKFKTMMDATWKWY